jgi:hypothetical protein
MNQPTAGDALRALDPLVGRWSMEARGPDGVAWPAQATSVFEWHPSGAHLIQRTTIALPEAPDSLSIMGCDAATGAYVQLYSDERGASRIYQMSMDDGRWELWRQGDPFPQRFSGSFSHDHNTITGRWEKAEDGITFGLDFTVLYRRLIS